LIVERQAFFVPFLREALEHAGHHTIVVSRSVSALTLQRVRPHTVVIGVHGLGPRPLETIRLTRRQRPSARIVAIVLRDDPAWSALARSLGADSVLGPSADHGRLAEALRYQATLARQAP
jgi:DNA-binding NarL/FixJ family response regulator